MKASLGLLLLTIVSSGGCANYWADRWADLQDPLTVTVLDGYGVGARAGTLVAGFGGYGEIAGYRDGIGFWREFVHCHDISLPLAGLREVSAWNARHAARGKDFIGTHVFAVRVCGRPLDLSVRPADCSSFRPHYGQLEAEIALGYGLRLGFNPLELLDAALGFVWIDVFSDDLNRTWSERASVRFVGTDGRPVEGVVVQIGEQRIVSDRAGPVLTREPLRGATSWNLVQGDRWPDDVLFGANEVHPLSSRFSRNHRLDDFEPAGVLLPSQHDVVVQLSDEFPHSVLSIGP
ncbi:MAG: hypothetical protein AAF196_11190 [Planctomycetota bacterium]